MKNSTKTVRDLYNRAEEAIANKEDFIYDVAAEFSQIVDNVSHMQWFKKEVMNYLIDNFDRWSHLDYV